MHPFTRIATPLLIIVLSSSPAQAQFFLQCQTGSTSELEYNVHAHQEHSYRLNQKFLDHYYHQGRLPASFRAIPLWRIRKYLQAMDRRRAGLLFYAHSHGRVCVWLLSPRAGVISHVASVDEAVFTSLGTRINQAIGVVGVDGGRGPRRREVLPRTRTPPQQRGSVTETLRFASDLLFPESIRRAIAADSLKTLVIVPVSPVGVLPFGALLVGETPLVDLMAVSIVPGFFALRGSPHESHHEFARVVVAGAPTRVNDLKWDFPPLPGARAEINEVAAMLGAEPLVDQMASKQRVTTVLRSQPRTQLIYLATHGIADPTDPLDGSFLLMSDGRWPAIEVQNLRLEADPLVVLSACQTGLGRDFDVGTIGMARAWERAGASAVVMSLWSVDDQATRYLMTRFLSLARSWPADEALRRAMQLTRAAYPDPASWAGFAVFGAPAR
jgi:hypothetical protein